MTISIIVPTLNEADTIAAAVRSARCAVCDCEIIVVDAHSIDGTALVAHQAGARVVTASGCRADAMNLGAAHATGEVLLFLHSDTTLPLGAGVAVKAVLATAIGGAFRISFDQPNRLIALLSNLRSRYLGIIYGDQAIFTSRASFDRVGGYRPIPIMEDRDLVHRLRRRGRFELLPLAITTSTRRHRHHGTGHTLLRCWLIQTLYHLGVSPARLVRIYPPIRAAAQPVTAEISRRSTREVPSVHAGNVRRGLVDLKRQCAHTSRREQPPENRR